MDKLLLYCGPAFLIAVGFMDPGRWATLMEGGSRFGYELLWVVMFSTLLAMLLQTISARLGVITGKHFAEVCREEYPWAVCVMLWVICEISIVTLDLTMVLGTAIGLNIVLQMPILPGLFLMTVDSLLFIVILPLMEMKRAEVITVVVVGLVFLFFLLDNIFISPMPLSMIVGLWPKLRHETLYTTVSIVGANVMPHNFYLHSALAKVQNQGDQSPSTLSNFNFWGTLVAFCAVLVVNLTVLIVAVTGFHNAGLVVLTLQDAQALIVQILNNSISPVVFGLAVLCAGQLSALNGSMAGQVVSETFLDYKIRPWQHRVWIRGIALVPAATCVWWYGSEGTYQMLVFSQVLVALHLPFTIAPLIKITSSERIMGYHKNSLLLEAVAWVCIIIIISVNVTLVFDLAFGDGEDDANFGGLEYLAGLQLLMEIWGENLQTVVFAAISVGTSLTIAFLVWLIFTPLQMDSQLPRRSSWMEEYEKQERADLALPSLGTRPVVSETGVDSRLLQMAIVRQETDESLAKNLSLIASPHNDPEGVHSEASEEADEDCSVQLVKIQEVSQLLRQDSCEDLLLQDPLSSPSSSSVIGSPFALSPPESTTSCSQMRKPVKIEKVPIAKDREAIALKSAEAEADADTELLVKEDDEMDAWESLEPDDVIVDVLVAKVYCDTSLQIGGPESGRSGRNDVSAGGEGESGSGSFSRLSGLGRAARRQFASILDEFWAKLFDLHGQPLPLRPPGTLPSSRDMDGSFHVHSGSAEVSDGQNSVSNQPKLSWKKASSISDQGHNMEAYMLHACTHAAVPTSSQRSNMQSQEYGVSSRFISERRYSSVRIPSYHEEYDNQPATIHGYGTPSFPGRTVSISASLKDRPLHLDVPTFGLETAPLHHHQVDSDPSSLRDKHRSTFSSFSQPVLRSEWVSKTSSGRNAIDIKGADRLLTQTEKHLGPSETSSYDSSQWDPLVSQSRDSTLGRWNPLVFRATGELDMDNNTLGNSHDLRRRVTFGQSPIGRRGEGDHVRRAPLVFDELSPSQSHRDGFSIQTSTPRPETQSLWSRQPFEQLFGATYSAGLISQLPRRTKSSSRLVHSSLSGSSVSDGVGSELEVLVSFQKCLGKLLRLDGADWLFRVDNGADEDLITAIAATQKTSMDTEMNDPHGFRLGEKGDHSHSQSPGNDYISSQRQQDGVPNCGKGCVWDCSLLVSFGVWCVHRLLELSLMESRPELWGKYTYVLNRLQGILEPAFSKPRIVPVLCRCGNDASLLDGVKRRNSSRQGSLRDYGSGDLGTSTIQSYPHPWPWGRNTTSAKGKGASASIFLDMIKEVETAVGSRKGRTGTAAGDVAFPKGKENLASVLKRYKRRLSSRPPGTTGVGSGARRVSTGFPHALFFAALVSCS